MSFHFVQVLCPLITLTSVLYMIYYSLFHPNALDGNPWSSSASDRTCLAMAWSLRSCKTASCEPLMFRLRASWRADHPEASYLTQKTRTKKTVEDLCLNWDFLRTLYYLRFHLKIPPSIPTWTNLPLPSPNVEIYNMLECLNLSKWFQNPIASPSSWSWLWSGAGCGSFQPYQGKHYPNHLPIIHLFIDTKWQLRGEASLSSTAAWSGKRKLKNLS